MAGTIFGLGLSQQFDLIGDFLTGGLPGNAVRAGDPEGFAATMAESNANYSAAKTAERLDKRTAKAELQAEASNSGMNIASKIRQNAASIVSNDAAKRGLQAGEVDALEQLASGTATRNTLRTAGNLLGGGGGMGSVVASGAGTLATGSPIGMLAPAVGWAMKKMENFLTVRQANKISESVRARSPLGRAMDNAATDWQKKFEALQSAPSMAKFSAFNIASRNLAHNLASAGVKVSPTALIRSVQGPGGTSADQE